MSRGIKITKVEGFMNKPEYKDLVPGTVFMFQDELLMKVVLQQNQHTYAIRLDNGYSYVFPADDIGKVTVVELHCEVKQANPYHYTVKPKKPETVEEEEEEEEKPPLPPNMKKTRKPDISVTLSKPYQMSDEDEE